MKYVYHNTTRNQNLAQFSVWCTIQLRVPDGHDHF